MATTRILRTHGSCPGLLICRSLVLLIVMFWGNMALGQYSVGIDFVSSGSQTLTFLGNDPMGNPIVSMAPYALSEPTSRLVTDGGFAGKSEAELQQAVFRQVQDKYYSVPVAAGYELDIDFTLGRVSGTNSINVILGETETALSWYGFVFPLGAGKATPEGQPPNGENGAAVSIENIASELGSRPGVTYDTYEKALNAVANITAHEIGHLYNLEHVCVTTSSQECDPGDVIVPGPPYDLMSTLPSGLPNAGWTEEMIFTTVPDTQAYGKSSAEALALSLGLRKIGDFDGDNDVDISDITTAVTNFTGAGTVFANPQRTLGDADHDGDIDISDVTTAVINFTGSGALAGAPGVPDLWYDPATGNITIDTDGLGDLGALDLQSAGGLFTGDPTDFSGLPVGATDDLDGQIGWVQPFAAGVTGVFDLGNVMQAGLTEAQFLADLAGSQYGIALGAGGGGGQIELFYGPYTAIPEPSSMVLLGLAGCMAVVGLRRRSRRMRRA